MLGSSNTKHIYSATREASTERETSASTKSPFFNALTLTHKPITNHPEHKHEH